MNFIKPINLLLLSGLLWLYCVLSLPASYVKLGNSIWFPVFTLLMFILMFVLGLSSIKKVRYKKLNLSDKKKHLVLYTLLLVGTLGVFVKVYQRLFVEKIYFSESLVKTRMDLLAGEFNSGILGLLSALSFPFATIALMLGVLWFKSISKFMFSVIALFGLFPIIDAVLTESRLIIVLIFGMLFFCFIASPTKLFKNHTVFSLKGFKIVKLPSILFKKKVWIPSVISLFVFVVFSQKVINNRLAVFGYKDTLKVWEIQQQVSIDKDFRSSINNAENNIEKNKLIGAYSLKHYFAHGVFEYIRLNNHLEKSWGYYYGMFEFYTYFKVLKIVGIPIPSFGKLNEISYKKAVYTTFWGPFYIDFGIFGFIVSFFLGRLCKRIYLKAVLGSESDILLYSFIGVIILASFFVNLAGGANLYFLNAMFVTILFMNLLKND